jgi:hypothetical protein
MSGYAVVVQFGDGEPPTRIELPGYGAADAETARESLAHEIEHALQIDAPLMHWAPTASDAQTRVSIDPVKVTGVDLIETS